MKIKFLIVSIMLLASITLYAEEKLPESEGFVNDFAKVLSSDEKAKLESLLTELEQKTTAEVVVLTVDTTEPLDIQRFTLNLFDEWKIGEEEDNGLLILVALDDRKVRIAVGHGLEEAISDAVALKIINKVILPPCRKGDFAKGVIDGAVAVANLVAQKHSVTLSGLKGFSKVYTPPPRAPIVFVVLFVFCIIVYCLIRILLWWAILTPGRYRRRDGFWYGPDPDGISGGFSGGFDGFGG